MRSYSGSVANPATGRPLIGAQIRVLNNADGSLASIYADESLTPLDNPLAVQGADTSAPGYFKFFADNGFYDIQYIYQGSTIFTDTKVDISVDLTAAAIEAPEGASLVGKSGSGTVQDFIDAIGADTGADGVGYKHSATGASARASIRAKADDLCDVLDFIPSGQHAAIFAGTSDYDAGPDIASALGQSAIVRANRPGQYLIDEMVEIGEGNIGQKGLFVAQGVRFHRPDDSDETTPLFWLKADQTFLKGQGLGFYVSSGKRSPDGLVLVGHRDMTVSHANMSGCEVSGLRFAGAVNFGQTTGDPDVGLKLCNPEIGDIVSYLHRIENVHFRDFNYAVHLQGFANGNFIRGIDGWYIGNSTLSAHRALIYLEGALENHFEQFFLHYSPGASCVKFRDLDNTGTAGGKSHVPLLNVLDGACEQDPTPSGGLGIDAPDTGTTATGNVIRLRDNCPTNDIGAAFAANNRIDLIARGYRGTDRYYGNIDFDQDAGSGGVRWSTGVGGDDIWRTRYAANPAGSQVTQGAAVVDTVYGAANYGRMWEDHLGNSLMELQGSTGALFLKGGIAPGTPAGAMQTGNKLHFCTGAPSNGDGANGDYCFRVDGTASGKTCLYHKESGSWVAVVL